MMIHKQAETAYSYESNCQKGESGYLVPGISNHGSPVDEERELSWKYYLRGRSEDEKRDKRGRSLLRRVLTAFDTSVKSGFMCRTTANCEHVVLLGAKKYKTSHSLRVEHDGVRIFVPL